MEVDKVADKVADMVAEMVADDYQHLVGHGGQWPTCSKPSI